MVVFGSKEEPRLRYLLTAMKYAAFARFAYVYLNDQSTEIVKMRQALEIKCFNCENIIIFNDFPQVSMFIAKRVNFIRKEKKRGELDMLSCYEFRLNGPVVLFNLRQ